METHRMPLSFEWSARREGNSGFVRETRPDGSTQDYGPLPAHIVPAFIAARRHYVHFAMTRRGFDLTQNPPPDWRFLQ